MIMDIPKLLVRYNGIGKPLSSDDREILLFALYNESEERGGIAADAKRECDLLWRKQQIVGRGLKPVEPEAKAEGSTLTDKADSTAAPPSTDSETMDAYWMTAAPPQEPPRLFFPLMEMAGEVDSNGQCPNCANPPHVGPCQRKQEPPRSDEGDVDGETGTADDFIPPEIPMFLRSMSPDELREYVFRFNSLTGEEAVRLVREHRARKAAESPESASPSDVQGEPKC